MLRKLFYYEVATIRQEEIDPRPVEYDIHQRPIKREPELQLMTFITLYRFKRFFKGDSALVDRLEMRGELYKGSFFVDLAEYVVCGTPYKFKGVNSHLIPLSTGIFTLKLGKKTYRTRTISVNLKQ